MASIAVAPANRSPLVRQRIKDRYWFKAFKWHLYKKHFGSPSWETRYLFDGFVRRLTADDIVIDCGANLGEFTHHLAANGSTVYAFEPDPYTFARLVENTAHLPTVTCFNQAVGVKAAQVKLFRRPGFDTDPEAASISSSLIADKLNVDNSAHVEVEQIDLIDFIQRLPQHVRLLKMDIEGSEVELLERMIASDVLDRCDRVFVETHEDRIPSLAERTAQLRRLAANRFADKLHLDWH